MPKLIITHPEIEKLQPSAEAIQELERFLSHNLEDDLSARWRQEVAWREALRQYDAQPRQKVRNVPVENAPNIEIPVGMLGVDIFYSISLQTVFNTAPLVSVALSPGRGEFIEHKKAVEDFLNWSVRQEMDIRNAAEHAFMDVVQLGTGALFTPWITDRKKTKVHKIISSHPQVMPWPIEDVVLPAGSFQAVQNMPRLWLRSYLTEWDLEFNRKTFGWKTEFATPASAVGWVRTKREALGNTHHNRTGEIYEVFDCYVDYDIDNDGFEEELLVTFDRHSQKILKLRYNPYDRKPIELMSYQKRAFLGYGMGMMEKLGPFQQEISDIHNYRNLNMLLANTRLWKVKRGAGIPENMKIYPGKQITMQNPEDLQGEQMGEIYNSAPQAEMLSLSMAKELVGINEMTSARPSGILSSRTPATTAQLGFAQQNSRFVAPFDSMRFGLANSIKQGAFRYQEQIKSGKQDVMDHINNVLGKRGQLVIDMLKREDFDESVIIELTATSERTSSGARLQSLLQISQIMLQYWEKIAQLGAVATNSQTPAPMREIALKISKAAGELVERIARQMDTIRDPKAFIIEFGQELDQAAQIQDQSTMNELGFLTNALDELDQQNPQGALQPTS
ncbi:hypothetical protein LCGC14_0725630 [marine sediment metagenome]|uniref:Portal protein n=1 Tax=marine sediment metagenome TaxID=412755 RepID=A0A0F9QW48_9ZZZZ